MTTRADDGWSVVTSRTKGRFGDVQSIVVIHIAHAMARVLKPQFGVGDTAKRAPMAYAIARHSLQLIGLQLYELCRHSCPLIDVWVLEINWQTTGRDPTATRVACGGDCIPIRLIH